VHKKLIYIIPIHDDFYTIFFSYNYKLARLYNYPTKSLMQSSRLCPLFHDQSN